MDLSEFEYPRRNAQGEITEETVISDPPYREAALFAPEEMASRLRQRLEMVRAEMDRLLSSRPNRGQLSSEEVSYLNGLEALERKHEARLGELRASSRQAVREFYQRFNYDRYFHNSAFGRHDGYVLRDQIEHLIEEKRIPLSGIRVLDVGCGNGRMFTHLRNIAEELKTGPNGDEISSFLRNIYGFDLLPRAVNMAKHNGEKCGIPPDNVFEGDFLNVPEEHQQGQYHLAMWMMHTFWLLTTDAEKITALKAMERALMPGGRLVIDTVMVPDHGDSPSDEDLKSCKPDDLFADLANYFTLLYRKYCEVNQPVVDRIMAPFLPSGESVPRLSAFPRKFIRDAVDFSSLTCVREIPVKEHIERLCLENQIPLRYRLAMDANNLMQGREILTDTGLHWLHVNGLREWLKREIGRRLSLNGQETGEATSDEKRINEIYRTIAHDIVHTYANRYLIFKKSE